MMSKKLFLKCVLLEYLQLVVLTQLNENSFTNFLKLIYLMYVLQIWRFTGAVHFKQFEFAGNVV